MTVEQIMTRDPACCTPDSSLREAAQIMVSRNCGEVPVVESSQNQHLVGVITDRDIACRAVAEGKDPDSTTVSECMTRKAVTVLPKTEVDECVKTLEDNQIRRVPVVDESGRCCGIVAQADIARVAPQRQTARLVKGVSQPENYS
jgi:CBS domain-containing protein